MQLLKCSGKSYVRTDWLTGKMYTKLLTCREEDMDKKTKLILSEKKAPWERGISVVLSLLSVLPLKVHEDGPPTFPVDLTWNLAY